MFRCPDLCDRHALQRSLYVRLYAGYFEWTTLGRLLPLLHRPLVHQSQLGSSWWHAFGNYVVFPVYRPFEIYSYVLQNQYVVIPTRRTSGESFQILTSHIFGDATSPFIIGAVKRHSTDSVWFYVAIGIYSIRYPMPSVQFSILPTRNSWRISFPSSTQCFPCSSSTWSAGCSSSPTRGTWWRIELKPTGPWQ